MQVDIHSIVNNGHYGKGEVIKISEDKIYVAFGKQQRIFPYPEAFDKGYLTVGISASINKESTLDGKIRSETELGMATSAQHTSELSKSITKEMFEKAYAEFIKQADENAISKKAKGSKAPYGIMNSNGGRSFDGAEVSQHFGQGGASKTPYINWWVVSIYYIPDNGSIILGIEEDRYDHLKKMKPLRYEQIGNKKTNIAVFYETTKDVVDYEELYEMFLNVSEEVMKLGLK